MEVETAGQGEKQGEGGHRLSLVLKPVVLNSGLANLMVQTHFPPGNCCVAIYTPA